MSVESRETRVRRAVDAISQQVPDVEKIIYYGSGVRGDTDPQDIDLLVVLNDGDLITRIIRISTLNEPSERALRQADIPVGFGLMQVHVQEVPLTAYTNPAKGQEYIKAAKNEGRVVWP